MKIKLLLVALTLFFSTVSGKAQGFMHSAGVTLSTLLKKGESMMQMNLSYFPRYNFIESERSSVSFGLPVGAGIGIASNTLGSDYGVAFAYDLASALDYNFGYKSTIDNDSRMGGYIGTGFGYYRVNISKSSYSNTTAATYGPMIRGGLRFGSEAWNGLGLTVGVFYKKGIEAAKLNTVGFHVLADF